MKAVDLVLVGDNEIVQLCLEEATAAGHYVKAIVCDHLEPVPVDASILVVRPEDASNLILTAKTVLVFCSPTYHQLVSLPNYLSLSFNEAILKQIIPLDNQVCCWFILNKTKFYQPVFTYAQGLSTKEEIIRDAFLELISSIARDSVQIDYPRSEVYSEEYLLPFLNLFDYFLYSVKQFPERIALVYGHQRLTYHALLVAVEGVSAVLSVQGNGPIALYFERNINMIVALLAVLKVNAAYLPLDPKNPTARNQLILEDARVKLMLCDSKTYHSAKSFAEGIELKVIDGQNMPNTSLQTILPAIRTNSVAYVIYTSGSTGKPKGVMCTHQGAINMIDWTIRTYPINEYDCIVQLASYAFDISVWEIFAALLSGASLVLAKDDGYSDPSYIAELIVAQSVTVAHMIPSILNLFLNKVNTDSKLRYVVSGGEELSSVVATKFFAKLPNTQLYHGYGPTECAITCLHHTVNPGGFQDFIPIGVPIQNTWLYIVDEYNRIVPPEVPGEAIVGGTGVAHGYLNNPSETKKRFLSVSLYRTGDLVKLLPNKGIQYLGRIDQQIKVRGNRVEIEEIERAIMQYRTVSACSVQVIQDTGMMLIAFCVFMQRHETGEQLRQYLSTILPSYMVPSQIIVIDDLPRTVNGKINKQALQQLFYQQFELSNLKKNSFTDVEIRLLTFLGEVLRIRLNDIDVDLISLGLNSIAIIYLINFIEGEYGVKLSSETVFRARTLRKVCDEISTKISGNRHVIGQGIPRVSRHITLPLSNSQARLWFLHQVENQQSAAYNILKIYRFLKLIDTHKLEKALSRLIARHEILRTAFCSVNGRPHQVIGPAYSISIEPDLIQEKELEQKLYQFGNYHFDLANDNALRVKLFRLEPSNEVVLAILQHNIVTDGWSGGVLLKELDYFYHQPESIDLPELTLQYADYAVWQNQRLSSDSIQQAVDYWHGKLKKAEPLNMPLDRPRQVRQTFNGAVEIGLLSAEKMEMVSYLLQRESVTLYTFLIAVLKVLLARYTDQTDIIIGTGYAGRDREELKDMLGFFINTIPLRTIFSREASFLTALHACENTVLEAISHSEIPFDVLVERLKIEREPNVSPLFQILFLMQDTADNIHLILDDSPAEELFCDLGVSIYDMTFNVTKNTEGLHIALQYNTDLYHSESIKQLLQHYLEAISYFAKQPQNFIYEANLQTHHDIALLRQLNDVPSLPTLYSSLLAWYKSIVEKHPNDLALIELPNQSLSYSELDRLSTQFATYLYAQYGAGNIIAIYIDKSLIFFISMLAIMKSGNTYLIIDTEIPIRRVEYILKDSGAIGTIINQKQLPQELAFFLTIDYSKISHDHQHPFELPQEVATVCYVLYTSGSTGDPKGVCITQANLLNTLAYFCQQFGASPCNILSLTATSFDIFQLEAYLSLLSGGTCHFYNKPLALCQESLAKDLVQFDIHLIQATPSAWKLILPFCDSKRKIRLALVGGENLESSLLGELQKNFTSVYNVYGPTETTIWSTMANLSTSNSIHLGQPISGTTLVVVDSQLQLLPAGCVGELLISGKSVSRGYLTTIKAQEDKFVELAFPLLLGEGKQCFYRTGDKVRLRHDGLLLYQERMDDQVKLRGYRIELNEISIVIKRHPAVHDAIVTLMQRGELILVGFILAEHYDHEIADELMLALKQSLPAYMLPAVLIPISFRPLNTNGKLDHFKLGVLYDNYVDKHLDDKARKELSPIELVLKDIWQQSLKIPLADVSVSFFYLGGSSLLITELLATINSRFNTALTIRHFIEHPTIAEQARLIEESSHLKKEITQNKQELNFHD